MQTIRNSQQWPTRTQRAVLTNSKKFTWGTSSCSPHLADRRALQPLWLSHKFLSPAQTGMTYFVWAMQLLCAARESSSQSMTGKLPESIHTLYLQTNNIVVAYVVLLCSLQPVSTTSWTRSTFFRAQKLQHALLTSKNGLLLQVTSWTFWAAPCQRHFWLLYDALSYICQHAKLQIADVRALKPSHVLLAFREYKCKSSGSIAHLANTKELGRSCQVQVVYFQPLLVNDCPDCSVVHFHGTTCQAIRLLQSSVL